TADELTALQDEAVRCTRELIRIDTTNFGGNDPATWGKGESEAAEYVVERLREAGLEPTVIEAAPGRPSPLVTLRGEASSRGGAARARPRGLVRLRGEDSSRRGLILHGHLGVVPARAGECSVDPSAAEMIDGMIYGRGAVDLQDMVGMILAVARHLDRTGQVP